ncbi:MAG: DegV family EDD domain-containing protein, partial [Gammaproteobacteria bacterium]|nr:DegV family EDD domain-containing protein [Gammaproteobacteria bacterium]
SRRALANTPNQLPVLQKAGVVDAGAQGFVNFLRGVARRLLGLAPPALDDAVLEVEIDHAAMDHDPASVQERFCTEVVVIGSGFDDKRLRRLFRPHGSSLLVASTGRVFKLHIHTNHPDEVIRLAGRQGEIRERKVDDMQRQLEERGGPRQPPLIEHALQPATAAVLCDSAADLPEPLRRAHAIEMAPLQVLFGDRVFRDQVDLDTESFYALLGEGRDHPSTSQPPPREYVAALERIRSDREVLIVSLSEALSGSIDSARQGARLARQSRIEVFDSGSASLGAGLLALNAARLAASGANVDQILCWLERWRDDTGLVFALASTEYLRRGGRIGMARGLLGKLFDVRPILTFEQGRIVPLARARGDAEMLARTQAALDERLPEGSRIRLGVVWTGSTRPDRGNGDEAGASLGERLVAHVRGRCEVVETFRAPAGGIIGVHAGPGAFGVFYQRVREDDPLL